MCTIPPWKNVAIFGVTGLMVAIAMTAALPAIAADAEAGAAIHLSATAATLHGNHLVLSNRGYMQKWDTRDDTAEWTVAVPGGGWYAIEIEAACEKGCGGKYEVTVGAQTLEGKVEATQGWRDFRTDRVGVTTELEGAGPESRAAGERSLLRRAIRSSDRRMVAAN